MPANKQKRKSSSASKSIKRKASTGLITSYPKQSIIAGIVLVIAGLYLLIFESHNNAMFGLAILLLFSGGVTAFVARIAAPRKRSH